MWSKFPDICLTPKNFNQEIEPIEDRTWARWMGGNDVNPRPQRAALLIESNIDILCVAIKITLI